MSSLNIHADKKNHIREFWGISVKHKFSQNLPLTDISFYTVIWAKSYFDWGGPHGRDRMVVGFRTTYAVSAYYH